MNWKFKSAAHAARDSAPKSLVCTLATAAAVALCGQLENGNAVAPLNAISHISYGDEALAQDDLSLKYTGTALALNKSANASWAAIHEMAVGEYQDEGNFAISLAGGAVISALAYIVDFHLVPKRLTPGFEHKLSKRSLFFIYLVLALSLGLGGMKRPRS
jgi:hypothetical protein